MSNSLPDLLELFDGLAAPTSNVGLGRFFVQPIPNSAACSIGKDSDGKPVLLIHTNNLLDGTAAPMVLENLSIIHLVNCRIQTPSGGEEQQTLSVVRCTGAERSLHEYFLHSLYPIIVSIPPQPLRQHVNDAVQRLVDLFRQLSRPPRKTVQGLWAELFVISQSKDPSLLLSSWHSAPDDRFDFASGIDRLEVKAASGRLRLHRFGLDQLRPPYPARVIVASILIERTGGGTSVIDLVDTIRATLANPDLLIRLDGIVAGTLGQEWRNAHDCRYDAQLASDSLRFVDAAALPVVQLPLHQAITDVHFRLDLSQQRLAFPDNLVAESDFFRNVIKRR